MLCEPVAGHPRGALHACVPWQAILFERPLPRCGRSCRQRLIACLLPCPPFPVVQAGEGRGGGAAVTAEALLPHHSPAQLGSFSPIPGAMGGEVGGGVARQEKIGVESVYHVQAVSILEEAIIRWGGVCGWGGGGGVSVGVGWGPGWAAAPWPLRMQQAGPWALARQEGWPGGDAVHSWRRPPHVLMQNRASVCGGDSSGSWL